MSKSGMSMNVAVSLGYVSVKPRRIDGDMLPIIDLPCQYSMAWHKDGLSAKDLYKMTKGYKDHTEAVQREYRL